MALRREKELLSVNFDSADMQSLYPNLFLNANTQKNSGERWNQAATKPRLAFTSSGCRELLSSHCPLDPFYSKDVHRPPARWSVTWQPVIRENLERTPDLLNQNVHFSKVPK